MFEKLAPFLPDGAMPLVQELLKGESFHLVITKPRSTKLGDFKPPLKGETPRLTVNGNLNPYSFLITLVHEVAHLKVWNKHKNRVKPHGLEWKNMYAELLLPFMQQGVFPPEIASEVSAHLKNPGYSTATDHELTVALRQYDDTATLPTLDQLTPGSVFELSNRTFKLGEKLRKRYICTDLTNGRKYRVHALAQVKPITSNNLR